MKKSKLQSHEIRSIHTTRRSVVNFITISAGSVLISANLHAATIYFQNNGPVTSTNGGMTVFTLPTPVQVGSPVYYYLNGNGLSVTDPNWSIVTYINNPSPANVWTNATDQLILYRLGAGSSSGFTGDGEYQPVIHGFGPLINRPSMSGVSYFRVYGLNGNWSCILVSDDPDARCQSSSIQSPVNPQDTLVSFRPNAFALRNTFNVQSAKIAQGLIYDCTVYDQKNMCVSFLGSTTDGKDFNATTGALILAHKPTNNFRFGGYIDQSLSDSSSFGGLTIKKGAPGYGIFGVWSQNADGSGIQVRAAANFGKVDMETTRTAVDSAEAGFGKSNIKSNGFDLQVSRAYAINPSWSARPYVGYRKTTHTRAGYTEQSSESVTAPLTYSALKQNTEAMTAGVTFGHMLSPQTSLAVTAGVEHDLKNRIDRYQATNADIGNIDSIDMGAAKKTRPTASIALNHNIDKTQRIGVSVVHRKEVFSTTSTTAAFVQYSAGF